MNVQYYVLIEFPILLQIIKDILFNFWNKNP